MQANGITGQALSREDVLSPAFLGQHFPKLKPEDHTPMDLLKKLLALWIPYNRVAAANNGYSIRYSGLIGFVNAPSYEAYEAHLRSSPALVQRAGIRDF